MITNISVHLICFFPDPNGKQEQANEEAISDVMAVVNTILDQVDQKTQRK